MQLSDVTVVKGCELNSLKKDLQSFIPGDRLTFFTRDSANVRAQ